MPTLWVAGGDRAGDLILSVLLLLDPARPQHSILQSYFISHLSYETFASSSRSP
ncbi:hypothetical protein [Thermoleptolyngbya sp. C42_A2020_037]|uniref:Uncharacterized protein n=1 Tax=Thermoleptolyngbya oregonensis NK1-22 TaxID=2547457 RepID=A0AA96Y680_9CYAN|nr:hypothetical protein [Thermoleptolyngbya sp. C42_A2020_037]MBF2086783.1 hypothetical protein [Thermoleptolyngbya sp. C42_A2020_037]WOB44790.1 hypothetical protein HNI00_17765 [Thermoleptolyngbya oregonensis NK1-22]